MNPQPETIADRVAQAAQVRLDGDVERALSLCEAILAARPDEAGALSLKAVCQAELGRPSDALGPIGEAQALAPDDPMVALRASVIHETLGDEPAAFEASRRACELGPDRYETWGRLGDLAGRLGEFGEAERALARSHALEPGRADIALRLAGARLMLNDHSGAAGVLDGLAPEAARHPEALRMRMAIAHQNANWKEMEAQARALLSAVPEDEEALGGLAYALGQQGYYGTASQLYRKVVDRNPGDAEHWAALGRLRLGARNLEEARLCFEKALECDKDCAEATLGLARLLTFTGDLEKAEAMCRRTLEIDPAHLEAYGQLGEVSPGALDDAEIERLETLLEDAARPADRRAIGYYALAEALHRKKRREPAFRAWERANALKVSLVSEARPGYDARRQEQTTSDLRRLFAGPVFPPPVFEAEGRPTPLFIVGMPRSGTTLLNAAFAAHGEVASGGELPALPYILADCLDWARKSGWEGGRLPDRKLQEWRERYLRQYKAFGVPEDVRFVTDKQPSNFLALGLIQQLFPDAPVIHIRRNPVETGFSIYRRNFSQQWPFADRLSDIAHYYAQYAIMAGHWDRAFPHGWKFIQYETLVDEFEPSLRALLEWAGLEFQARCLEYYKDDAAVMTFSAAQVRKPPTASHKSAAEPYRAWLGELCGELEKAKVNLETGALDVAAGPARRGGAAAPREKGFWRRLLP